MIRAPRNLVPILLLVASLVLSGSALAKGKSKKKKPKATAAPVQTVINDALDARTPEISRCALKHVSADNPNVDIHTHVVINQAGAVVTCQVTTSIAPPGGDEVRACVEKVIRIVAFPRTAQLLLPIDHNWGFKLQ